MHWEVVDNDGLNDFHKELGFFRRGLDFALCISDVFALSDPEFHVDICDLLRESVVHGLHD